MGDKDSVPPVPALTENAQRLKLGEFTGVDWGEEDKVPEDLFKNTVGKKR